jgi:hypothetical protein
MVAYENHHDTDAKTIIGGVQLPQGQTAEQDLAMSLDTLFNHPNVGPFIGKQLIERLVTSNPSPAYIQRVATVFNDNGSGTRGDLLAVVKAILTDPEAVTPGAAATYGKLREPLLRMTNLWRAFSASNQAGQTTEPTVTPDQIADPTQGGPDTAFGEYPMSSQTVFNFFQPGFSPSWSVAGAASAGLLGPEFEITNESTSVMTNNTLMNQAYTYIDGSGTYHQGTDFDWHTNGAQWVYLHTAPWESMASDPGTLVDQLNMVFMAGQMSAAVKAALVSYATAIPATTPGARVLETAELLIESPQYAVQR